MEESILISLLVLAAFILLAIAGCMKVASRESRKEEQQKEGDLLGLEKRSD